MLHDVKYLREVRELAFSKYKAVANLAGFTSTSSRVPHLYVSSVALSVNLPAARFP